MGYNKQTSLSTSFSCEDQDPMFLLVKPSAIQSRPSPVMKNELHEIIIDASLWQRLEDNGCVNLTDKFNRLWIRIQPTIFTLQTG